MIAAGLSKLIACKHDHTATNVSEAFSETLQQWKLEENKLVGIATDSCSNIKAVCEILGWVVWTQLEPCSYQKLK